MWVPQSEILAPFEFLNHNDGAASRRNEKDSGTLDCIVSIHVGLFGQEFRVVDLVLSAPMAHAMDETNDNGGGFSRNHDHDDKNDANDNDNAADNVAGVLDRLYGSEHFLVGLSPQYWACTPMLARDFQELVSVGGIDCFAATTSGSHDKIDQHDCPQGHSRFIPVSKCRLVGLIVDARPKNGSMQYLLDDGTGLVDCLVWNDNAAYTLPLLLPDSSDNDVSEGTDFEVGDVVEVHGKIRTVSAGPVTGTVSNEWNSVNKNNNKKSSARTTMMEKTPQRMDIRTGSVREVHATSVVKTVDEHQTRHWFDSLRFLQTIRPLLRPPQKQHKQQHSVLQPSPCRSRDCTNGVDLLRHHLKGRITEEVVSLSSAPDSVGPWQVFGPNCQCQLAYKEALLYCHCIATPERLDPNLVFRDALLYRLVELQDTFSTTTAAATTTDNDDQRHQPHDAFYFQYMAIATQDAKLQQTASLVAQQQQQQQKGNTSTAVSVTQQLFRKTFAHLRNDGIVHLVDEGTDTYMLLSKDRVLVPYVQQMTGNSPVWSATTAGGSKTHGHVQQFNEALRAVPSVKIHHVKRLLGVGYHNV